ncbi:MAG TPA: peptide chain release factor N(5)-glutamine methyltransferase [Candidatus Babeliales bacterium]|nr:peptide chain release factor N(5)-glutamine methyltransferase [Candidatus Babeliales bacterium]
MNTNYDVMYYINDIRHKIASVYDDDTLCQQYAWWILQAICEKTKTELVMQASLMISLEQKKKINQWIQQLVEDKIPIQYLLGSVPFADCDILVEPPILIPRPETEEWSLYLIEQLRLLNNKKIKILDLATGSGCIAIAFAHHLPQSLVVATDVSNVALMLTEKNIEHNVIRNIICIQSDLFTSIPRGMLFDMIISNPPYIASSELSDLDDTVRLWEDHNALIAADNGLAIIKEIIVRAPYFIQTNDEMCSKNIPQIVIEIGYTQGVVVKKLMLAAGYNDIFIHKDLEGKDRFITGRVDYVANSYP